MCLRLQNLSGPFNSQLGAIVLAARTFPFNQWFYTGTKNPEVTSSWKGQTMSARLSTLAPAERSFVHGHSCLAGTSHAATFAKLTRCAPPPTDRAGWMAACRGALACLRAASSLARTLSPSAQEILTEFSALLVYLENITPSHIAESAQPMWRRLAQFPQWVAITRAYRHSDEGQLAALGLELFYCLHQDSVMAAVGADRKLSHF